MEKNNDNFEHLGGWDLLVESRQYRGAGGRNLNLRQVADFAFLDLIAAFILSNEYETSGVAKNYADKTISFRSFTRPRLSGTDLYVSLNILTNPDSVFSKQIQQNAEADELLRQKINIHMPTVRRYLDLLADNKMSTSDAQTLLLRLEKQLNITDSKLKSIRRLAQDWTGLSSAQRELLVTRMLQYYKKNMKRSELGTFLADLGKTKGYKLAAGEDAEMSLLSVGLKALAPLAAAKLAYELTSSNRPSDYTFSHKEMGKWRGSGFAK